MDSNTPIASSAAPRAPINPAPTQALPQAIPIAQAAEGAAQPVAAPPSRRSRHPRGLGISPSSARIESAPALLTLAAALPMYTEQRRAVNHYVPDAQMMFHVLGICDNMMNATDRFLRSSPAWLPIVSQLYLAILWLTTIIRNYVNSGYAFFLTQILSELETYLSISECMIPGPLVPFFQSLAAINGPFDWIGDVVPALPSFSALWNAFAPTLPHCRFVPIPVILLDQLHHFSQWPIPANQSSSYPNFEWYRNIFSHPTETHNPLNRMGPQRCASNYTTQGQFDNARNFWNSALASGITRTDSANAEFTTLYQLFGFTSQTHETQINWFQHVVIVMQKYCLYFNGSVPLKAVSPTGLGSSAVFGRPVNTRTTRAWIYPSQVPGANLTNHFPAMRELPSNMPIIFEHSDHDLEEVAEQYAILTHTNIQWNHNLVAQFDWPALQLADRYSGDYWHMMPFRLSNRITLKTQYAQVIASRYHQQAALHTT